jgi:hypothetical protein
LIDEIFLIIDEGGALYAVGGQGVGAQVEITTNGMDIVTHLAKGVPTSILTFLQKGIIRGMIFLARRT